MTPKYNKKPSRIPPPPPTRSACLHMSTCRKQSAKGATVDYLMRVSTLGSMASTRLLQGLLKRGAPEGVEPTKKPPAVASPNSAGQRDLFTTASMACRQ